MLHCYVQHLMSWSRSEMRHFSDLVSIFTWLRQPERAIRKESAVHILKILIFHGKSVQRVARLIADVLDLYDSAPMFRSLELPA